MKVRKDLALIVVLLVAVLSVMAVFFPAALVVLEKTLPAFMLVLGSYFKASGS